MSPDALTLPIPQGSYGEPRFGEALRIAEQIEALMFATPQPSADRDFITAIAQFHAGARKSAPPKPHAMTGGRAKEIRQRGRNARGHYLNTIQWGDALCAEFEFEVHTDLDGVGGLMRPDIEEAVRWHIIRTLKGTTLDMDNNTITLTSVAAIGGDTDSDGRDK